MYFLLKYFILLIYKKKLGLLFGKFDRCFLIFIKFNGFLFRNC